LIAYVFWHSPRAEVSLETYENAHRGFLESLTGVPPEGLRRATVFRVDSAPWLLAETQVFEDWYLLDGSAALDVLNDAAIAGRTGAAHDQTAPLAANGTAGLYRLRLGTVTPTPPTHAHWFSKPEGMSYSEFFESLADVCDRPGVALWGRQMVLGPTPEFCLHSDEMMEVPYPGVAVHLSKFFDGSC
jgi:hypothetical protein